jgi:YidC/Oxa1 family membrane protein insertase
MSYLFNTFFYNPLYNGLILVLSWLPSPDVGIAVILFTFLVKFVLFPLSKVAVRTQLKLREVEPQLNLLKEKYKDNREKQAVEMLALYKTNGINPFSGILLALIQFPIVIALYYVFFKGGLPVVDINLLYPYVKGVFMNVTQPINVNFLNFLDVSKPQVILAILAGIGQFVQIQLSIPKLAKVENPGFKDDLAQNMNTSIRYVLPVFILIISLKLSGALALYFIAGSIFTIGQELYLKKTLKKNL